LKDEGVGEFEPGKLIAPMLQRLMATDRALFGAERAGQLEHRDRDPASPALVRRAIE
jgi:hypothetical protein